jgi:hypothetical protein
MAAVAARVLDEGLPALPGEVTASVAVPLACWKSGSLGAVLLLTRERDPRPGSELMLWQTSFTREVDRWVPRHPWPGSPGWNGPEGPRDVSDPSGTIRLIAHGFEPDGGARPAIVAWGWHSPEVAEICLVQDGVVTERLPAKGHHGAWIIGSASPARWRVEGRDRLGTTVGSAEPHWFLPEDRSEPVAVVTPAGAVRPHRYGGLFEVVSIERHEARGVLNWRVTLDEDPDRKLLAELEANDADATESWDIDRLSNHLRFVDALKAKVRFGFPTLTDDLGTRYEMKGGGSSSNGAEVTRTDRFEPAIPENATTLTVQWEDVSIPVDLR